MQQKSLLIVLTTFFFTLFGYAQQNELTGKITDKQTNETLPDTRIELRMPDSDSTLVKVVVSNEDGNYSITDFEAGSYVLKITYFGYEDQVKRIQLSEGRTEMNVAMKDDAQLIEAVTIDDKVTRVEQKGDTTQYNAEAFKTNPDATVEDLVTKMPGITMENGAIKAQGEQITKVLIDGEEFFGDDAAAALKNLPAEIVSKIQVYDQASDQSKFTGISDGNEAKALNIVTKNGKNQGQFGKIYGGYGYPGDLYMAGANVNFFKGSRRISIIGMSNNVNQQNFSTEDILGVTGTSNSNTGAQQGGRTGGGGRGGAGGSGSDFLVGQQSGVSTTHSIGINYSEKWGTKTKVTGSYFFNGSRNNNSQSTNRTYFVTDTAGQLYNENYSAITTNYNHRLNFKFDIALDSMNSLVINPKISYQSNDNEKNTSGLTQTNSGSLINQIVNSTSSDNKGINASNSVLWRHRFDKPKRTISINLTGSYNNKFGNNGQQSISNYYDPVNGDSTSNIYQHADNTTDGYSISSRISYTEPIGEKWSGEFFYAPTYSANDADKRTYDYDTITQTFYSIDTSLSNVFNNRTIVNETGANFRYAKDKTELQLGISYQNSTLLNDQEFPTNRDVQLSFNSIIPNVRYKYSFTKNMALMLNYRAATTNPTISQLQNVVDNSNPLSLSTGNPELKQQYNHSVFGRFNITDPKRASNFFVFLAGQYYANYITNSSLIALNDTVVGNGIVLQRGSQFRQPVNLDGSWNTRTTVSYGIPVYKFNLNFNAGAGYSETPGLINNKVNKSQVTNTNAGVTIASNISEKVDFTISYTYNYNNVVNTQQSKGNSNYFVQNVGARFNWIIKERLVINSTYSLNAYAGLSSGYNQYINLWNGGIGYKLLKNKQLEARVSVFDILNNNKSIARNVTETYVEDVRSKVLNRYYMFTLTYSLKNFGTPPAKTPQDAKAPGDRPFDGPPH